MQAEGATEVMLIRHAPAQHGGRLAGRRDVPAELPQPEALVGLRAAVGTIGAGARLVASPALRCRQTAQALWPDVVPALDPRLWEQDFGAWEGVEFAALPDLGALALADLAAHCPPGGESFADICARVAPALREIAGQQGGGRVAVVAHAGVVRAGLALATGQVAAALAFQVAPLSVTTLWALPGGHWSVAGVNRVFA